MNSTRAPILVVSLVAISDSHLTTRVARYPWGDIDYVTIREVDTVGTVVGYSLLAAAIAGLVFWAVDEAFEDD